MCFWTLLKPPTYHWDWPWAFGVNDPRELEGEVAERATFDTVRRWEETGEGSVEQPSSRPLLILCPLPAHPSARRDGAPFPGAVRRLRVQSSAWQGERSPVTAWMSRCVSGFGLAYRAII